MTPILGILDSAKYGALHAGNYYSIATATVTSGGQGTITFSSIPQTYTHLQARIFAQQGSAQYHTLQLALGGGSFDTGSTYPQHYIYGNGSTAGAGGGANGSPGINFGDLPGSGSTNIFGVGIVDILDYTNTSKYKTVRILGGNDKNGSGVVVMTSGFDTTSTNAITGVQFVSSGNYSAGTVIALYGVK
jgi:hypothetical protein